MIQLRLQEGYCIDTSALIDMHTNHYPPDIFPGLWKDLESLVDQGLLIAPDEVFHEICVKDDGLAKWGKSNKKMFIPLDVDQSQEVSRILEKFPGPNGNGIDVLDKRFNLSFRLRNVQPGNGIVQQFMKSILGEGLTLFQITTLAHSLLQV